MFFEFVYVAVCLFVVIVLIRVGSSTSICTSGIGEHDTKIMNTSRWLPSLANGCGRGIRVLRTLNPRVCVRCGRGFVHFTHASIEQDGLVNSHYI